MMKLYDKTIEKIQSLMEETTGTVLPVVLPIPSTDWPDEGKNQLIFGNETAYELGGSAKAAVSGVALTEDISLVNEDQILRIGPDLTDISGDVPYARIALIRLKEDSARNTDQLYKMVRALEYVRFHIYPKGFMMRISSMKDRETVRIRRNDLSDGLSFAYVGKMFLEQYHKFPEVEAVKLIFITDPAFDFGTLSKEMIRSEEITKTLDHLANKVNMDCAACSQKELCDEVEEMLTT